jgi:uncharacterized coiled-coil DUF342 family protein
MTKPEKFSFLTAKNGKSSMAKFSLVDEEPAKNATFSLLDEEPEKVSFKEHIRDVPHQAIKGAVKGLGSTGSLLDLVHAQPKQTQLPGQKARSTLEAEATPEELPGIVDDDDIIPRYSRVANNQEINDFIEQLGGPGRGKNPISRFAGRASEFITSGPGKIKPALAAAGVGQGLEEANFPPWVQAVGEIFTLIKTGKRKGPITSKTPEVKNKIEDLRKLGYSEQDLTLAKNALEERGFLEKISELTPKAELKFKDYLKGTESKIDNILKESYPGIENGLNSLKEASGELYKNVDELAKNVIVKKPRVFINQIDESVNELKRSLGNTPQEKQVINLLEEARTKADERMSPFTFKTPEEGLIQVFDKNQKQLGGIVHKYLGDNKENVLIEFFSVRPEEKHTGASIALMNEFMKRNVGKRAFIDGLTDEGLKFSNKAAGVTEDIVKDYKIYPWSNGKPVREITPKEIEQFQKTTQRLKDRLEPATTPADFYTNFYQGLNEIGDWKSPRQREFVFSKVKDALKNTFRSQGKEGEKLANLFEGANESWKKYRSAEEVLTKIQKATTEDGINFNKLAKAYENPDNYKELVDGLGKERASNLKKIVDAGREVSDLRKRIEGNQAKKVLGTGKLLALAHSLVTLNVTELKTVLGAEIGGRIATKILTEPAYQNLYLDYLKAVKQSNFQKAAVLANRLTEES